MRESLRVTDNTKKKIYIYYIYINTPVAFRATFPDIRLRFHMLLQPGVFVYMGLQCMPVSRRTVILSSY